MKEDSDEEEDEHEDEKNGRGGWTHFALQTLFMVYWIQVG
jgi:hypothetical protein